MARLEFIGPYQSGKGKLIANPRIKGHNVLIPVWRDTTVAQALCALWGRIYRMGAGSDYFDDSDYAGIAGMIFSRVSESRSTRDAAPIPTGIDTVCGHYFTHLCPVFSWEELDKSRQQLGHFSHFPLAIAVPRKGLSMIQLERLQGLGNADTIIPICYY